MKNLLQRSVLMLSGIILPYYISAKPITGTVRDAKGETVIGASVVEQNTTNGTVTDFDGNYQLDIADGKTLVVSYVGYTTRMVRVAANKSIYDIVLEEDNAVLEDVVVVGYGTQKRSDVTGAISSVSAKEIESFSTKSLAESLQGLAAGVSVTKGSGGPGEGAEILIRGAGNLSGMSPLYVVDGVAQDAGFNFNMRDVESIEILKDAGSAAIYGSRAAGGVILITTKHGRQEKTHVTLNIRAGWRKTMNKLNLLGTEDWITARDIWGTGSTLKTLGVNSVDELPNTNWMDVMYGTGVEQEYNIGISHSSDKTNMFMSIGYMDEKGTYMGTRAQRFSFRTNLDHKVGKHVSIGESLYGSWSKTDPAAQSSVYYHTIPFRTVPVAEVKDADGNYAKTPEKAGSGPNFAGIEDAFHTYHNDNYSLNARAYLDVNFIEGLNWHTNASATMTAYSSNQFQEYKDFGPVQVGVPGGQLFSTAGTTLNLMFNSVLTYDHTWGDHHFKAMAGTEWWRMSGYGLSTTAYNFTVSPAQSLALSSEGPTKDASDNLPQERRGSAFARINYEYGGRYMLAVNFRADASDRFSKKNRWGFFPSVNAGWRMSEEPWIKEPAGDWLSNMKIRASWGMLGNDNVAQYMYESTYAMTDISYSFTNSPIRSTGAWLAILGNEDLRWEQVNQWDIGLDLGFLNNRLTLTYDYYNRQTRDMIYRGSLPLSSGMSYYFASDDPGNTVPVYLNAGLVENQGHEISLGWKEKRGDFEYGIVWNASFNQNMVKQVGDAPGAKPIDAGVDNAWSLLARTEDGRPMGQFYGYKCIGVFQDQAEVDAYNRRALDGWKAQNDPDGTKYKYAPNGQPLDGLGDEMGIYYQNKNTGVGDLIFDNNGQYRVNEKSRQFIGNPWPKMEMGLTLNFAWKGIDLSAVFAGAFGFDIMNLMKPYTHMFSSDNTTKDIFKTSCFGLGNTEVTDDPRVGFLNSKGKFIGDGAANKNYSTVSSYLLEKGDYFKLKNLSVGYTLPRKWTVKAHIEKLRLYFSAQNVFTITKYSGNDPEIGRYSGNQLLWNVDTQYRYLPNRLFSFGLDVMF
ncbi:MAG: TonB-dependent receptor [Paludibacteraceae bacterium]|nr:TonB-dependent receptor [Paludibacteraceae bacterium]